MLSGMSKMIQVRNVPDRLHRALMKRAKASGQTLTDYIQSLLEREMARPAPVEVFARIASREPVRLGRAAADFIRDGRAAEDPP